MSNDKKFKKLIEYLKKETDKMNIEINDCIFIVGGEYDDLIFNNRFEELEINLDYQDDEPFAYYKDGDNQFEFMGKYINLVHGNEIIIYDCATNSQIKIYPDNILECA